MDWIKMTGCWVQWVLINWKMAPWKTKTERNVNIVIDFENIYRNKLG